MAVARRFPIAPIPIDQRSQKITLCDADKMAKEAVKDSNADVYYNNERKADQPHI